jgi:hypothetical protein
MDNPNNIPSAAEEAEPITIIAAEAEPDAPVEEDDDFDPDEPGPIDIPQVIEAMLKHPLLLLNESKEEFDRVYDDFLDPLAPETVPQHWLVWNSAILTWEVMRYRRTKIAYMQNERRMAVSTLIRKAFSSSSMRAIRRDGSDVDANIERYFTDPAYPPLVAQALEKAGYSIDAVEAEMLARSLDGLVRIEKLIASGEKRLMLFFREMERIHGDRAIRAKAIAEAHALDTLAQAVATARSGKKG